MNTSNKNEPMSKIIRVTINDEVMNVPSAMNIQGLIDLQELAVNSVALVCNGQVVPKSQWQARLCNEDDRFEIFSVVAGG